MTQTATPAVASSSSGGGRSSASSSTPATTWSLLLQRFSNLRVPELSVRGRPLPRWMVVGGGLVLTAAAAAAILALLRRAVRRRRSRTLKGGSDATATGGAPSSSDVHEPTFDGGELLMENEAGLAGDEREFRTLCARFLEQLGGGAGPEGNDFSDDGVSPALEREVRSRLPIALERYNAATRSLAAHMLLAVNAYYLTRAESEEQFHSLMVRQRADMLVAWELLACNEQTMYETRTLDVLRIQVAQCLKDARLMLPLFERMASHPPSSLNIEEAMLLYTCAPLLGRWDDTIRFGERLHAHNPDAEVLHQSSMDYNVLLDLARTERTKGNAPLAQLQWREYKIRSQRLRLLEAKCANDAMRQDLEAQFTSPDGERAWQVLRVTAASEVVRCGAIAQLKSFSPAGVPLVGPADDRTMKVRGEFVMADGRHVQTETYRLERVSPALMEGGDDDDNDLDDDGDASLDQCWKGEYTMVQGQKQSQSEAHSHSHSHGGAACSASHGSEPILTVTFQLEMVLRPRPSPTDAAAAPSPASSPDSNPWNGASSGTASSWTHLSTSDVSSG